MPTTDTDGKTTTTTSLSLSSRQQRRRRRRQGRPPWVLHNYYACVGSRINGTTAVASTRNNERIEASLWAEKPPLPSNLFLQCPAISEEDNPPRIVQAADDLVLFRVAVVHPRCYMDNSDYFIYRADPKRKSLALLPHPHPFSFRDFEVSLLPRGDGDHFTIAALVNSTKATEFKFHLFNSEDWAWTSYVLPLHDPHCKFPVEIPKNSARLKEHFSSTVVTLGGEDGTVGWVDLWSGVLLYKVLGGGHSVLRGIPVPLPMDLINNKGDGMGVQGCPKFRRGIAFKKGRGCLTFAEVVLSGTCLSEDDVETGAPSFQIDDWTLTTWSNSKLTNCWEDWELNSTVKASEMAISDLVMSSPAFSELLNKPWAGDAAAAPQERALHNLVVSEPAPSMDDEDVVYLMARAKFQQLKAWVLAVDMTNKILLDVAEFGTATKQGYGVIFHSSSIFSKRTPPAITPDQIVSL